jgi:DNA polymerase-3 subunit gamma/tau
MGETALYRRYRSQSFEELVGQEHITKTLQSAIRSGRIAHAYLFVGPRGTGKTSAARILAKCLCCEKGPTPEPCLQCDFCKRIADGSLGDVMEMDAASEAGVEEVRQNIVQRAQYAPMEARYRIFIIDEVHDLSQRGFDALLKTIEEPPPNVVFILATTEQHKVPVTIRSRCQRYEFRRGALDEIEGRLKYVCEQEGIEYEPEALRTIARLSDGGYRDALTLLEQAHLAVGGRLTRDEVLTQLGLVGEDSMDDLLRRIVRGEVGPILEAADALVQQGKEPKAIVESLALRLNELTHALYLGKQVGATKEETSLAAEIGPERILAYQEALAHSVRDIRDVTLPRVWLELTLVKLASADRVPVAQEPTKEQVPAPQEASPVVSGVPQPARPNAEPAPEPPKKKSQGGGSAAAIWEKAKELLASKFTSSKQLLGPSVGLSCEGKVLIVGFKNQFAYERLQAKLAKAQKAITEAVGEVIGEPGWSVQFRLHKNNGGAEAREEVDSEVVEGEDLVREVQSVFQVENEA